MGVIVIGVGARQSAGENFGCTWKCHRQSQTNSDRCLGSYGYSVGGLQVLSQTLQMSMSNRLRSTSNMMNGLLSIITSESY